MFHSPHKTHSLPHAVNGRLTRSADGRHGFTMIELLMAVSITSMLSVVLGGLMMAVQTAHDHSQGLQTATTQATAAIRPTTPRSFASRSRCTTTPDCT